MLTKYSLYITYMRLIAVDYSSAFFMENFGEFFVSIVVQKYLQKFSISKNVHFWKVDQIFEKILMLSFSENWKIRVTDMVRTIFYNFLRFVKKKVKNGQIFVHFSKIIFPYWNFCFIVIFYIYILATFY